MKTYKIETIVVTPSVFKNAEELIPKRVQPALEIGAKKGWVLHTFTSTESSKGINICLVWEVEG